MHLRHPGSTGGDEGLGLTEKRAGGIISHMSRHYLLVLASSFPYIRSLSGFSACASDSSLILDTIGFFLLSVRGWWVFKHSRRDVSEQGWPSSASCHRSIPSGKPLRALESPASPGERPLQLPAGVYASPDAAHRQLCDTRRPPCLIAFANCPPAFALTFRTLALGRALELGSGDGS